MHRLISLLRSPLGLAWLVPAPVLFVALNSWPRIVTTKAFGTSFLVAHYGWPFETYNVTPPPEPQFDILNCIPGPPDAWSAFAKNVGIMCAATLFMLLIALVIHRPRLKQ